MRIKQTVDKLCKQYGSNDPFILASCLNTVVLFEKLGSVRGYYSCSYQQKVIHINSKVSREQQKIICAHELGHSILHPDLSTPFLRANTLFSVNKLELQANKFMVQLLVDDRELDEHLRCGYTIFQMEGLYGFPEHLIQYKINTSKGCEKHVATISLRV